MEIKIIKGKTETFITSSRGALLGDVLTKAGMAVLMPCGGKGRCGKCIVKVSGGLSEPDAEEKRHLSQKQLADGYRLACRAELTGDAVVELQNDKKAKIQTDFISEIKARSGSEGYGAAVDIGTTTIAAYLFDLSDGTLVNKASALNPQSVFGADVISRIEKSLGGEKDALAAAVGKSINSLVKDISSGRNVLNAVITGNTAMLYFLTSRDVKSLSSAPFEADCLFGYEKDASEIGIDCAEKVYLPHCIAAFAGADLSCAVLASDIYGSDKNILLIDIGTNGEVYLNTNGKAYCCSAAAGPAFEGSGIKMGMNAADGAISRVWFKDGSLEYEVIGQKKSVGICGSGLLDAVATFLDNGCIDSNGLIKASCGYFRQFGSERCLKISDDVIITQSDIRALQLAKGAIRAAIDCLLDYANLSAGELDRIVIAGGFGSALDIGSAVRIGLLPKEAVKIGYAVGNAAAAGAARILVDETERIKVFKIAKSAQYIELSGNQVFAEHFIDCINF